MRARAARDRKARDGGLSKTEDPLSRGSIQPFCERGEHHGDLLGGGFQTIQGGVTTSTEGGAAGLTTERLDQLDMAMFAITDEGVDVRISVAEVPALRIRTSEPFGVDASGGLPGGFSHQTRDAQQQALALHPTRLWSRVDRPGNRLASGASRDVGAWCAPGLPLSTGQDLDGATIGNKGARVRK